jgi:ATP-binding cassette, subfamily F, member 3
MIHLNNLTKRYGQKLLFENASFQINPGDKIGLVGPNGAGKSTIFKIIMREEGIDSGDINVSDRTVIGYFSQDVGEMKGRSALEEVMAGAGRVFSLSQKIGEYERALEDSATNPISDAAMEALLERYGEAQAEFSQLGGYDLDSRSKEILTGLGIGPLDFNRPVESFSGGWKMRIALAKILVLNPDVLLMDEPTNHLDLESILWLEEWLRAFKGSLVMTSHDREFMNRLVTRIVEVSGKTTTTYTGDYEFYLRERGIRREQLLSSFKKQADMLAKEEEFIARFAARASHAAQVQSRVKKLDKVDRIEIPPEESVMNIEFFEVPRSGNDVVVMKDLSKDWMRDDGTKHPVFGGASAVVRRTDKIAVVGINGAGKSTLLKTVIGTTEPTGGQLILGSGVRLGYFSQHSMDVLDSKSTVYEEVYSHAPDANITFIRGLLGAFLFSGDDVHKKISVLSGGEKSRVVLASILAKPINFLVLDEPTNHLDIKSREVLLKALQDFDGTVMLVSHDRHFLRQVTNRVFEIHRGHMNVFEGNYDYYLQKRKQ